MLQEGELLRFWEIERDERQVRQRWGSVGREEGEKREEFRSPGAAKEEMLKQVGEHIAQGWRMPSTDDRGEPAKVLRTAPPMEQLERTIEAHPDEPDAWRVYADWLQQHGDPRGELAAMQQKRLTRAQIDAFVMENRAQLLGPLDDSWQNGELELSWRWGFVRAAKVLAASSNELSVADVVRLLLELPSCRFLQSLEIAASLVERTFAPLAASPRARHLRRLVLSGQSWFSSRSVQPMLDACTGLKELVLRHLAGQGVKHERLELLSLTQPVGEELAETLGASALPALKVLSVLPAGVCPLVGVVMVQLPQLEVVSVVGDRYSPTLLLELNVLVKNRPAMKELRFSQPSATVLAELPKHLAAWSSLKRIEISGRFHPALQKTLAAPNVVIRGRASALAGANK
jgi:uncharacterized protein (TIGR02996 family)